MSQEVKREIDKELGEGFQIVRLHYSADPEKDENWAKKVASEYPTEDFKREFELEPVGLLDVRPVFGDYKKALHESDTLVYKRRLDNIIYRGWDFGKIHPCVEFLQVNGLEKNFIDELYGDNIYEEQFIQRVLAKSQQEFPGAKFIDWVDGSGRNEDRYGNSSFKTMRQYGMAPKYCLQEIEVGITQVSKELVLLVNGRPHIMINPKKCPHLAAAMRGGYKRNKKGDIIKDGTHDHPVDAARYVVMGVTFSTSKNWDLVRHKMKNQYNKFPTAGKTIRR